MSGIGAARSAGVRRLWRGVSRQAAAAVLAVLCLFAVTACSGADPSDETPALRVLVIGDEGSDSAVSPGWPNLLATREADGVRVEVVTDAVEGSGYLTASPASVRDRIAATIEDGPPHDVVVIALGAADTAYDAPEAIRVAAVRDALTAAGASGARVVVLEPIPRPGTQTSAGAAPERDAAETGGVDAWNDTLSSIAAETGAVFVPVDVPPSVAAFDAGGRLSAETESLIADRVAEVLAL